MMSMRGSIYNDYVEQELGEFVSHLVQAVWNDDGTLPSYDLCGDNSRRLNNKVVWKIDDVHGRYVLFCLYEAIPAKPRLPAQIVLQKVRMIMWGKFCVRYDFDRWRSKRYASLGAERSYDRAMVGRWLASMSGNASAETMRLRRLLHQDHLNGDPDAVVVSMTL